MSDFSPASTEDVKYELEKLREQAQREALETPAEKLQAQKLGSIAQAEIQAYDLALMEHSVRDLVESSRQAAVVRVEENRRRVAVAEHSFEVLNGVERSTAHPVSGLCQGRPSGDRVSAAGVEHDPFSTWPQDLRHEIEASWETIFDPSNYPRTSHWQATVQELRAEDVTEAARFVD